MEFLQNNPYLAGFGALAVVNLCALILLWRRFARLSRTQKQLLAGEGEGAVLQDIVLKQKKQIMTANKNLKEIGKILEEIIENNKLNIQKIGVVRYNPFANTGGNMSFVIALLDARDNGILISSLHSREGTRIYAKSLRRGISEHNLTAEEETAIRQANQAGKNYEQN